MEETVLAVIANYDFSDNADRLKASLSPFFETVLLDNSSPTTPKTADYILPNHRYTGLWNSAVRLALEQNKDWLLFVASDIQIPDAHLLAKCVQTALTDKTIGIYTPALQSDSRFSFQSCGHRETGGIRECYLAEGFFFLARTCILKDLYPIPLEKSRYGYGIDIMAAFASFLAGYKVVVDDRVMIHHPPAKHETPNESAMQEQWKFMGPNGIRFMRWVFRRYEREGRKSEGFWRLAMKISRPVFRFVYKHNNNSAFTHVKPH